VGFFEYKLHERDVGEAEAGGFVPDAVLLKEADSGHGVPKPGSGLLPPDAYSDQAFAKIMNWKSGHRVCLSFSRCAKNVVDL
jgi:hypothetical protein